MKSGVLEKVTARIAAGTPIRSFTKPGQGGYLLRYDTFNRYRRENPDFVPRDNQGETAASIRMRMRRGWRAVARA